MAHEMSYLSLTYCSNAMIRWFLFSARIFSNSLSVSSKLRVYNMYMHESVKKKKTKTKTKTKNMTGEGGYV